MDSSFAGSDGVPTARDGRIAANRLTGKASGSVWAIGDAVTGPATAAEAMGLGKRVAKSIDAELMGRDAFGELFRDFGHSMTVPPEPVITSYSIHYTKLYDATTFSMFATISR